MLRSHISMSVSDSCLIKPCFAFFMCNSVFAQQTTGPEQFPKKKIHSWRRGASECNVEPVEFIDFSVEINGPHVLSCLRQCFIGENRFREISCAVATLAVYYSFCLVAAYLDLFLGLMIFACSCGKSRLNKFL